jgi:nitroreductase
MSVPLFRSPATEALTLQSYTAGDTLSLLPDELLTTTRAVRRRLDFDRPVEREVIEECVRIAQQAPSAGNGQPFHFLVVSDAEKRRALADLYRPTWAQVRRRYESAPRPADPADADALDRLLDSAQYLADHLHEVPVHVVPCITPRPSGTHAQQFSSAASIYPAVWSFMLAARARGLGTCLTTLTLFREEEAAAVLGVPYEQVALTALIPLAYAKTTAFKPARRVPLDRVLHWDAW